jgi:ketosteroid isomerase-like protein
VHDLVRRYVTVMQLGPDGHDELVALFAEDGVYVEPFTAGAHRGRDAIRAWLAAAAELAPPDLRLHVDRVEVRGREIEVAWTCESPAFLRPSRGIDRFTIRDGAIERLETTLTEPPELRG